MPQELNIALPMSSSSNLIAAKAAEGELQRRVESLQKQLHSATRALESLQNSSGETSSQQDAGEEAHIVRRARSKSIAPPPGKRGYLFKWLDRSIGVRSCV